MLALLLLACAPPAGSFEVVELQAESADQVYTLTIFTPDRAPAAAAVVYLFDGDDWTHAVAAIVDDLDAPPLGIGYGDLPNERARDHTPAGPGLPAGFGEVEAFYAFLIDELVPWVDTTYPTAPTAADRTVLGHSFGGAAAMYGLLTASETFGNAVVISPSLTLGEGALFDLEAARAAEQQDLVARAWLGAGALEAYGLAGLTEAMGETLASRGYPSLALETALLPNRVHTDVFGPAAEDGLRFVLEAP